MIGPTGTCHSVRFARSCGLAVVLAAVLAAVTSACAGCTDAGCTEGVTVDVPVPDGDEVDVAVTVERRGRVVARAGGSGRVEIVHPNGESCEPHCRQVTLRMRDGRLG